MGYGIGIGPLRNRKPNQTPAYIDNRWKPASNRDNNHPAFNQHPAPQLPPHIPRIRRPHAEGRPTMHHQNKRIVVVFGDASIKATMKGHMSASTKAIKKRLVEKSRMFGVFTQADIARGVDPALLGQRRFVVLDIDEFKTSVNINKPLLPPESPAVEAKHVQDIYAVVVENGTLSSSTLTLNTNRTLYCMESRH